MIAYDNLIYNFDRNLGNILYDRAQASGRLHGLRHDGHWLHIGTPEALHDAERTLARLP